MQKQKQNTKREGVFNLKYGRHFGHKLDREGSGEVERGHVARVSAIQHHREHDKRHRGHFEDHPLGESPGGSGQHGRGARFPRSNRKAVRVHTD